MSAENSVASVPLPFEPSPVIQRMVGDDAGLADCKGKRIGILVVAYNAVSTLDKVLKRITPNVWKNVEEIAVFDDASQDATFELTLGMKAHRSLPKLSVIRQPRNLGYGGNQKAGYRYFMDKGFDVVVLLHGDGQYAPEILSHLYGPVVRGEADAVFGSRMMRAYGGPLKGGMPLYKYIGNRILSSFENSALGTSLSEFHSGYRAYNLHALRKIRMDRMTDDFHFDTEIIIKLHHQLFRIAEVPIPTYYGDEICYVNGMKYARDVVRAVHRYRQTRNSVQSHPEFEEYFVNYSLKKSRYSSHSIAQRLVGLNDQVLDIGCGDAYFASELKAEGNRHITGADFLAEPRNASVLEQYFQADLDNGAPRLREALRGKTFDSVLLLDVIEHLRLPEELLKCAREWVKPDGRVILSAPNVAHLWMRLHLLFGKFEYSSRGILDSTHLRFYTRRTLKELARRCGFEIVREEATVVPLELVTGLSSENPAMRVLNGISAALAWLWPSMFGYQTILVLKPAPSGSEG
ncbi:MAG: methyltransferase domain-containing protein [Bryobacteraceae bacterium]|nr:methyltransferase domain-containing protein [Bryobacteraceae bacterium]